MYGGYDEYGSRSMPVVWYKLAALRSIVVLVYLHQNFTSNMLTPKYDNSYTLASISNGSISGEF